MMPRAVPPISTRFTGAVSAQAMSFRVRSSTMGWRCLALPGIMTYLAMFFS